MEYQNIDETARRQAYERVKQLAEAIKKIRKKYYLCFNKISDSDKQRYEQLIAQMQSVASENGLEKSYMQLMADVDIEFDGDIFYGKGENGKSNNWLENLYKKFIRAVQLQAECTIFFSKTDESVYLRKASQIQEHLKKISEVLEKNYRQLKYEKSRILGRMFEAQTIENFYQVLGDNYRRTKDPLVRDDLEQILGMGPYSGRNILQNLSNAEQKPQLLGR